MHPDFLTRQCRLEASIVVKGHLVLDVVTLIVLIVTTLVGTSHKRSVQLLACGGPGDTSSKIQQENTVPFYCRLARTLGMYRRAKHTHSHIHVDHKKKSYDTRDH